MQVTKRDGSKEDVRFDKIAARVKKQVYDLSDMVNHSEIAQKVIQGIYDGVSTRELDQLAAQKAAALVSSHPDYSKLAARIAITSLHKETKKMFSQVIKELYEYVDPKTGEPAPLISEEAYKVVKKNSVVLNGAIIHDRDFLLDYFGFRTMERSYLLKTNGTPAERPQHLFMRVAVGIHLDDIDKVLETYDLLSQKYFTHATPTLFNAATPKPQMSSCFLLTMQEDSIEGIYDTLKQCALISQSAGGIGLSIHNIRATGSYIKGTNGTSNGIVPMLRNFNDTARYVDQCFPGDTITITENQGAIPMSEINVGDKIMTSSGKYEEIRRVLRHPGKEGKKAVEINTLNSIRSFTVTEQHPILALRNQQKALNHTIILNRLEKGYAELEYVDAGELTDKDFVAFPIPTFEKDIELFSEEDCRLYGILVGDGYIPKGNAGFVCHVAKEGEKNKKILDFLRAYCIDRAIKFTEAEDKGRIRFRANGSIRFPFGRNMFYDNENEKKIDSSILNLPKNKVAQVIRGLIESDGSVGPKEVVLEMTSKNVIDSVFYMMTKLGALCSGHVRDRRGNVSEYKQITTKKVSYSLRIPKISAITKFFDNIEDGKFFKFLKYDGYLLSRVKEVKSSTIDETLYDLEVQEGEPTYYTELGIAHNGGGKRKGSFAIYLEPWHADVRDFLDLKKNTGKEERRARDLFYAMWIPDLFMKRVEENGKWTLMCPNECPGLADTYGEEFEKLYTKYEKEGRGRETIEAQELWFKILESQIETGTPYMLYKDSANRKSNQKHLGTIKSSNLCMTEDQRVVTSKGYLTVKELYEMNEELELFNGEELVKASKMKLRGKSKDVYKITLENGLEHTVTAEHGIPVMDSKGFLSRIEVKDLNIGDKVAIQTKKGLFGDLNMQDEAYLLGLYQSDGTQNKSSVMFDLWEQDFDLIDVVEEKVERLYEHYNYTPRYSTKGGTFIDAQVSTGDVKKKRLTSTFFKELGFNKGSIPKWMWSSTEETQWEYIKGLLQADGTIHISDSHGNPVQLSYADINRSFLQELQLLFNNLGLQSSIHLLRDGGKHELPDGKGRTKLYDSKPCYRLVIGSKNNVLEIERKTGFLSRKNVILEDREYRDNTKKSSKVLTIEYVGKQNVYCPTVYNDEHIFVAQGMKTFNCTEIIEYTAPDEVAVCNLASIALPMYLKQTNSAKKAQNKKFEFDFQKLYKVTKVVTKNLNKVIDRNYYPVEEARKSNVRHRPIGIGVQGLADVFAKMGYAFDSDEARDLNRDIFEMIYFAAMEASMEVAQQDGPYETFPGSDISKGIFQFDYWEDSQLSPRLNLDWSKLKEQVKTHGARNSLLLAPMPTASTAQILGNNECFEPYTSNIYERKVLSGNFVLVNPHLVELLVDMDIWNDDLKNKIIANRGSVQGIKEIPEEVQNVYKTVWEISQRQVLQMAADRGAFICQSQSMNVFMDDPTFKKLTSMHFYGWKAGLKTGMYYLRTKPAADAIQFTVDKKYREEQPVVDKGTDYDDLPARPDDSQFECFGCGA